MFSGHPKPARSDSLGVEPGLWCVSKMHQVTLSAGDSQAGYSKCDPGIRVSASPGSLLDVQILKPTPDL